MKRVLSPEELYDQLRSAERSLLRWEHQPHYVESPVVEAEFEAWRAGTPLEPSGPEAAPWIELVQRLDMTTRIRVQENPPTSYQRWLEWCAETWSIPIAGEQIRVLPRQRARAFSWILAGRYTDWWLIDRQRLLLLHFDPVGELSQIELCDDRPAVLRARLGWGLAARSSTPIHVRTRVERREPSIRGAAEDRSA